MEYPELIDEFVQLCDYGLDHCPQTWTMRVVRIGISALIATRRQWFAEEVGKFLYKNRAAIFAGDADSFINRSYEAQYSSWIFLGRAMAKRWETTIKTTIRQMVDDNPELVKYVSERLITLYCDMHEELK